MLDTLVIGAGSDEYAKALTGARQQYGRELPWDRRRPVSPTELPDSVSTPPGWKLRICDLRFLEGRTNVRKHWRQQF
jgi:hypothetical protein